MASGAQQRGGVYEKNLRGHPQKGFDRGFRIVCSDTMLNNPTEDYWNCVCLLLPRGKATLIDIEDFEQFGSWDWQILGDIVNSCGWWLLN